LKYLERAALSLRERGDREAVREGRPNLDFT